MVMGPPAAGKSAYVDATASPDAIVLDMSRLLPALAPQVATVHMNSAALSTALSAAWAGTYNRLVRLPQPVDVWIVASLPTPAQIADWVALDYDMHVMEQSSITTAEKLSNSDEMNQARARQWYTLGLTQAHVDALKARRHTQLRSVGLMASIADESKSSW
ncbi:MAG: hypothetical protein LKJ44_06900 [Bifidobacteriaceae bacterium]|nr:hypothetical protein [Bifidobacteriaceae bacterium]MCI1979415.1 hypothetical protein [Bifidobacteriaceae bacterium]